VIIEKIIDTIENVLSIVKKLKQSVEMEQKKHEKIVMIEVQIEQQAVKTTVQ
jgi:hypothetical protein